jgi:DNA-3-methyladenine glycosylase I
MEQLHRCTWAGSDPIYEQYHDEEWGVPLHDDVRLFEMLNLEGAQAGLSWITILKKRDGYRKAFDNFDPAICAAYSDEYLESLRQDPGIVRNKLKIYAVRANARAFLEVVKEFNSFDNYIWSFVDHKPVVNFYKSLGDLPANTPVSDTMSADLKKRGFKFVGSTICYAYMQSVGMVNDHTTDCFRHAELVRSEHL